jgi:hypothetical protein
MVKVEKNQHLKRGSTTVRVWPATATLVICMKIIWYFIILCFTMHELSSNLHINLSGCSWLFSIFLRHICGYKFILSATLNYFLIKVGIFKENRRSIMIIIGGVGDFLRIT